MPRRVLILGGTGPARKLAERLVAGGHEVTTSLAGVTSQPAKLDGQVRTGGFGGTEGLAGYLRSGTFDVVVDATHPFAARISANSAQACGRCGVRLVRLEPPAWPAGEGDRWWHVPDTAGAVALVDRGAKAFLTIGRKELSLFSVRRDIGVVARMIEAPDFAVPQGWRIVLARPPFTTDDELALMRAEGVSVLVSKNAGGERPAKLDAARALDLPVIMIARPEKPDVETFTSVEEVVGAVAREDG